MLILLGGCFRIHTSLCRIRLQHKRRTFIIYTSPLQAYVSTQRIIGMLLQEEIDPDAIEHDLSAGKALVTSHRL